MADKKISQLPTSTTPLAGTEELAVVQSGDTKKVSVNNLTAGKAVNASSFIASQTIRVGGSTGTGAKMDVIGAVNNSLADFGTPDDATILVNNSSGAAFNQLTKVLFRNGGFNLAAVSAVYTTFNGAADIGGALSFGTQANASGGIVERVRIDNAGNATINNGNLVIGTSGKGIDASTGYGNFGSLFNQKGTVSADTATPTTLFTSSAGLWIVYACIVFSGGPAQYTASAQVLCDGNGARIVSNDGVNLLLTLSGLDVQVTQTSGSTQTVNWSCIKIGL